MPSTIALSIVVIGRNEGERLTGALTSITRLQEVPENMEILYVDSASTDDSVKRASQFPVKILSNRLERPSAASARNIGWRAAQGEFIFFLDGDSQVAPDFINRALPYFEDPQIGIIFGDIKEKHPERSPYNQLMDVDWKFAEGCVEECPGIFLARRKALEEIEGFNSDLIAGEDFELGYRLRKKGYKIFHLPFLMAYHDFHLLHFREYWRRNFRTGYAYATLPHRFKDEKDPIWKKESQHNLIKGGTFFLLSLLGIFLSFLLASSIPLILIAFVFLFLIIRTSWRVRERGVKTSLLYGLHSHFQHIPMFLGQVNYWWDAWRGKYRSLIEYKKKR